VQKFQQLLLQQSASMDNSGMDSMKFAPLMDYNDHGSDYDDDKVEPLPAANLMHFNNFNNFSKFLGDPNITKQLENIKQMDVQRYLNDIPSGASGSLIDPLQQQQQHQGSGITLANINSLRGPPPQDNKDQDVEFIADFSVPEVIPINSRSPTPTRHKRRKSRTRSRSRDRGRYRRRRSRSRSRSRSYSRSPRNKRRSSRERAREKEREAEKERRRKGLPDIKKDHLSVCSTTLWVGHLSKLVQQEELSDTFGKYGDIISIDMIPPRGCAYIVMNRRQDAYKAMQSLKNHKMQNRTITISWAAGKGVKSKEWKDYFDQTLGVTYIPFSKLAPTTDFVVLEEGGMYDDETMPIWVKEKLKQPPTQTLVNKDTIFPQFFPQSIDTSQPPPNASMLPAMPPFSLGARPLLVPTQGMLGLGVPPPNMLMPGMIFPTPGDLKIPPGLMGFSLPTANQQQVLSSAQVPQQPPNDDQMDIEMDDESSSSKNDGNNIGMAQGYFNQPPPMNIQNLIMQNQLQNEQQNDSNDFNNRMSGNRNNRSQSRERDNRDFRSRGPRDRNDRRSNDFNRNQRWSNDTNGDRNRSRGGDGEF
jgi:RNA-binding protein 16